jgi:hypothetical protein
MRNERPQTSQASLRVIGVQGCGTSFVTGVPGIEQIKGFFPAYLPDQNPVGAHTQSGFQQRRHGTSMLVWYWT